MDMAKNKSDMPVSACIGKHNAITGVQGLLLDKLYVKSYVEMT